MHYMKYLEVLARAVPSFRPSEDIWTDFLYALYIYIDSVNIQYICVYGCIEDRPGAPCLKSPVPQMDDSNEVLQVSFSEH